MDIVLIVLGCWLLASVLAGVGWASAGHLIKKRRTAGRQVDQRSVGPVDGADGSDQWPRGA